MSAGFGFSVGDFIAALKIVSDVIDALRDSGNSTTESRLLLRQLYELETALILVRRLELDEAQADQLHALRRAALQCRTTMDEFMKKIQKYQPHLHSSPTSTGSIIKQSWYKIRWALCRKEDIEKFKADLAGHTEAINILMNAITIQKMNLESATRDDQHFSLKTAIMDCYNKTMRKLSAISDAVTSSLSHSKKLLEITAQTAQIDCKIFGAVLDIEDLLRRTVAPQILRAQPVYFIDALGIPSPFHLEFVRSTRAFLAVLRCNMKGNDLAVERIDQGDFVISDVATRRDIDLSRPWSTCFRPGQMVDMSMIMKSQGIPVSSCPSCKAECSTDHDSDVVCQTCGLTFRRLTELEEPRLVKPVVTDSVSKTQIPFLDDSRSGSPKSSGSSTPTKKRKREDDISQELTMYRKIRLWQPRVMKTKAACGSVAILDQAVLIKSIGYSTGRTRLPTGNSELHNALDYLDQVQLRYNGEPKVYGQFLEVLNIFKLEERSYEWLFDSVKDVFDRSPYLIEEFKAFLPENLSGAFEKSKGTPTFPVIDISGHSGVTIAPLASPKSIIDQGDRRGRLQSRNPRRAPPRYVCDICDKDIESNTSWYQCMSGMCADELDTFDICSGCYDEGHRCDGYDDKECDMVKLTWPSSGRSAAT